jgi:hypothetical protein
MGSSQRARDRDNGTALGRITTCAMLILYADARAVDTSCTSSAGILLGTWLTSFFSRVHTGRLLLSWV